MKKEKYLVTPALPYANGPCHLGHLVEHIQVNIFVRALKMAERDVLYICGADSHGTPIEMNAQKANIPPFEFAQKWQKSFDESFRKFFIEFDGGFQTTHSSENEAHAGKIFDYLKKANAIEKTSIEQLFDPKLKRFLPDRMVKGTCPFCKAKDQYGDSCESCGKTYNPTELIDPTSALSGSKPVLEKSEHYFVKLSKFDQKLKDWLSQNNIVSDEVKKFLDKWFLDGLKDWDISRDGPYFGFLIPGESNKYFYVWLDAPIGYISISEKAAKERGLSFKDYWLDKNTKIIHFIGKDIVYFHTLFWPAMLMASGYNLPKKIYVHGMLTVNGEKMSKSRGTFIAADTYLKHLDPESLRYYYASKLTSHIEDIDLNLEDFIQKVNTDLVNKLVNLVSRTLPLLHKFFEGKPSHVDNIFLKKAYDLANQVKDFYLNNEPAKAVHEIVRFSEEGNKYLQDKAPWKIALSSPKEAQEILTTGLYIGKVALGLLKPVLPQICLFLEKMLNDAKPYDFNNICEEFKTDQKLQEYTHLFKRIEESQVKAMIEESKEKPSLNNTSFIDINQFMAVDLRSALVLNAKAVEGSDKLIECFLDVGELGKRTIFTGIRPFVEPEYLIGKTVVIVANLAPRKMRFGISEGMILSCGDEIPKPLILSGSAPGEKVR